MRFLIVTGLSGAGKSEATRNLEDLGYFCVDNLPPTLIPKFADVCIQSQGKLEKIALVIDIRGGLFFDALFESLIYLKKNDFKYEILFLEAKDDVLVKRFKESRRTHPLAKDGRVTKGIALERSRLKDVKEKSDNIIDTSNLSINQLREKINSIYGDGGARSKDLSITILSFGFKYGIPLDADLVFDVRFIPNPFYIPELKKFSGLDSQVKEYVLKHDETKGFVSRFEDMLEFLIPNYTKEGKKQLIVAIGCTGGRHRSVAISRLIYENLVGEGRNANIDHRDINEDSNRGEKRL